MRPSEDSSISAQLNRDIFSPNPLRRHSRGRRGKYKDINLGTFVVEDQIQFEINQAKADRFSNESAHKSKKAIKMARSVKRQVEVAGYHAREVSSRHALVVAARSSRVRAENAMVVANTGHGGSLSRKAKRHLLYFGVLGGVTEGQRKKMAPLARGKKLAPSITPQLPVAEMPTTFESDEEVVSANTSLVMYDSYYEAKLIRSGDVEQNPGPFEQRACVKDGQVVTLSSALDRRGHRYYQCRFCGWRPLIPSNLGSIKCMHSTLSERRLNTGVCFESDSAPDPCYYLPAVTAVPVDPDVLNMFVSDSLPVVDPVIPQPVSSTPCLVPPPILPPPPTPVVIQERIITPPAPTVSADALRGYNISADDVDAILVKRGFSSGSPYEVISGYVPYCGEHRLAPNRNVNELKLDMIVDTIHVQRNVWDSKFFVFLGCVLSAFLSASLCYVCFDLRSFFVCLFTIISILAYVIVVKTPAPYSWKNRQHLYIPFIPHLVSCIVAEYDRHTNIEVFRSTVSQKIRRLAMCPIPDRDHINLVTGTIEVAETVIQRMDFFWEMPTSVRRLA